MMAEEQRPSATTGAELFRARRASARPLRRGGSIQYLDVAVTDIDGKLVAKGLVTYKLG